MWSLSGQVPRPALREFSSGIPAASFATLRRGSLGVGGPAGSARGTAVTFGAGRLAVRASGSWVCMLSTHAAYSVILTLCAAGFRTGAPPVGMRRGRLSTACARRVHPWGWPPSECWYHDQPQPLHSSTPG